MTQHIELDYLDPVHEGFFDAIQEMLGAAIPNMQITVASATTLQAAGSAANPSSVAIEGRYRWRTTNTTAALPGGLTNGIGDVYVTGSDNVFTGPVNDPDTATDYNYYLSITTSGGDPGAAIERKIGEVDVVSSAITAFRPTAKGWRHPSDTPLFATADHASQAAATIRGAASQTADILRVETSAGTAALRVDADGDIVATQGIDVTTAEGLTLSANGGKDTLNLSNTAADVGLTIGGDTNLYRGAANTLATDDAFASLDRVAAFGGSAAQVVIGDQGPSSEAGVTFGSAFDTNLYRSAANTLKTDDNFIVALNLTVTGSIDVGGSLTVGGGTIIGGSSAAGGDLSGTFANLQIIANAVGTTEIADSAVTNAKLAGSIALSKLATDPLARANHTGTQLAATISNFDTQVRTSRLDQMAAPTAAVSMASFKLTNLADATTGTDALNRQAADTRYGETATANDWLAQNRVLPSTDTTALILRRGTDTSPTADVLKIQNAAGAVDLLVVSKDGGLTLAGPMLSARGTVGAPGISFAEDPNTGIYQASANENALHFAINGAEVVAITAATTTLASASTAISGALAHSGGTVGFYGVTPAARPATRANSSGLSAGTSLPSGFTMNQLAQYVIGLRADGITLGVLQ